MAAITFSTVMKNGTQNAIHTFFTATHPTPAHAESSTANDGRDFKTNGKDLGNNFGSSEAGTKNCASTSQLTHCAPNLNSSEESPKIGSSGMANAQRNSSSAAPVLLPMTCAASSQSRKRRKIDQELIAVDVHTDAIRDQKKKAAGNGDVQKRAQDRGEGPSGKTRMTGSTAQGLTALGTPPKKMLKLSGLGKLGSPGSTEDKTAKAPGSPRKRGQSKKVKSCIIILRYSTEAILSPKSIGQRIAKILSGQERFELAIVPPKIAASRPKAAAKAPHPFFSSKTKAKSETAIVEQGQATNTIQSPKRPSAATPGKIRQQIQQIKALSCSSRPAPYVAPPSKSVSSKSEVWPLRGALHVRGQLEGVTAMSRHAIRTRKQKHHRRVLDSKESVLKKYRPMDLLRKHREGKRRADGFLDPHPSLRVPSRLLLTGPELSSRVTACLSLQYQHAVIAHLIHSLPTSLTPYDHGKGEKSIWVQKYAPKTANMVLQTGDEAIILRDWMRALTVMSVSNVSRKNVETKPRKKRRKRTDEMDDFLVSSGDESDTFGTLTELHEPGSQGSHGRSMIRTALDSNRSDTRKTANAVLLSGSHGSGKTAMVYAAAKELGFQVFEIHAGDRRSGRDILERVGDVLGNHIVSHDRPDAGNTSVDEDASRHSAALQKDIESGRQGTMKSFFTTKAPAAANKGRNVKKTKQKVNSLASKSQPGRQQKQSIILLEDVDVLFEEDKAFWTTVISILTTSRRPVVLTCRDESLLPSQDDIVLEAILRLPRPPVELCVDYLTLIAAHEGHLLCRDDVQSLVRRHGQDIRSSMTELQFWCQMGVGDPRGGLTWIYQRWPPGTGVDAQGHVKRVVSEGTYHSTLGALTGNSNGAGEQGCAEQMISSAWSDWGLDPRDEAHHALGRAPPRDSVDTVTTTPEARLRALRDLDHSASTLSTLDVFPSFVHPTRTPGSIYAPLGSYLSSRLDPTQPRMPSKQRLSYTERPRLVQSDEATEHHNLGTSLVITASHLLSNLHDLPLLPNSPTTPPSSPPLPRTPPHPSTLLSALDPITASPHAGYDPQPPLLRALTTDILPYVRQIVAHDARLARTRKRLHEAVHGPWPTGGTAITTNTTTTAAAARERKTRAARGALEGKGRKEVRREEWWGVSMGLEKVLRTGGEGWTEGRRREAEGEREEAAEEEE